MIVLVVVKIMLMVQALEHSRFIQKTQKQADRKLVAAMSV